MRHVQPAQHALDAARRARRVGDEHDRAAAFAEAGQRADGLGIMRHAVMHDAPDIAENDVVTPCDLRQPGNRVRCVPVQVELQHEGRLRMGLARVNPSVRACGPPRVYIGRAGGRPADRALRRGCINGRSPS